MTQGPMSQLFIIELYYKLIVKYETAIYTYAYGPSFFDD